MKHFIPVLTFVMCCIKCVAQTYIEPVFDRCDYSELHINKIEITRDTTFVHCTYIAEAGSWARISKDTYLYDCDKHKKYTILRCSGLPFTPQQRNFRFGGTVPISFCFPNIGNATRLDLIEDSNDKAFNIYGINLKEHYNQSYKKSDYEHYSNMSSLFDNSENDSLAIQYKKQEIEAAKYLFGIKSIIYSCSQFDLVLMYDKYGDYQNAVEQMKLNTELQAELHGKENADYAIQLFTLGRLYFDAQNYEKASILLGESIALYESLGILDNGYALALSFMAYDYNAKGDDKHALCYRQKCLNARRNMEDADKYINELYNVALEIIEDKNIDKTRIQIIEDELSSLPSFVDSMSLAFVDIYEKIAFSYTLHKDFDGAILYCDKALALLPEIGMENSEKYAEVLSEKSRYQKQAHQIHEAITTGEKSKQIFEALQIKSTNYAWLLSDLAGLYRDIEDYEKAIQLYEWACDIYKGASEWLSFAENLNDIGFCYKNKYEFDKAEIYIKKGLDVLSNDVTAEQYVRDVISEEQKQKSISVFQDRIQRAKSSNYSELANIYSMKGEKEKAIEAIKKSLNILKDMPNDQDLYTLALGTLANFYRENKQFDEAIENMRQCLLFWDKLQQKQYIAAEQLNLAYVYFEKGDTIQSIEYAQKGVSTLRSNDNPLLSDGLCFLSVLYYKSMKYREAEACLSEGLDYIITMLRQEIGNMSSEQKQRVWNKYKNLFIEYRDLMYKGEKDGAKISKLYNYILFSKSLLLDSEIYGEDRLSTRLNVTWKDIQKKLSDDDIAIEFIATIDERTDTMQYGAYHALVIDKDCQYPKMITLIHDKGVENSTEHVSQLWNPILDQYKEVKNIYFSPDGVMHGLPIENLYVDNIGFLSDKYNMYRLSSTKELVKQHEKVNIKSAVLFGGLTFSNVDVPDLAMYEREQANLFRGIKERGGFDPLNYTFIEVKDIKDILEDEKIKTSMYTREKGTEEIFKELSGKKINLIHLATHGMYVDTEDLEIKRNENNFGFLEFYNGKDPVREDVSLTHSFLVMSGGNMLVQREIVPSGMNDGILTAKEISKMDLAGLDLVVLSACETAHGEITVSDGILGLHRGFKKAGANTILMSTSKVDDEATTILMIEFYKNLMLGKSKLKSLKDAQKYLREFDNGKYIDPKYWRPFIMLDGLD